MLERLLNSKNLWGTLHQIYWFAAGMVLLAGIPMHLLFSGPALIRSSLFFGLALIPCYFLSRRWPAFAVTAHILLGGLTLPYLLAQAPEQVFQAAMPDQWRGVLIGAGIWITFSTGVFGGVVGAVLYTLVMMLALPGFDPASRTLFATLCFGSGMSGVALRQLIGRLEQAYIQMDTLAHQDSLTRLGNRRLLEQEFSHYQALARREDRPLLLSLWDLDSLKQINDKLGHQAGDEHILRFAQILQGCSREGDRFYRTGGDEFCGIHLGMEDGEALAVRAQEAFPQVSVGFSEAHLESLDHALRQADQGMYRQKQHKRAVLQKQ